MTNVLKLVTVLLCAVSLTRAQVEQRVQPPTETSLDNLFQATLSDDLAAGEKLVALANAGDAQAQFLLGLVHASGTVAFPKDSALAINWLQKAAEQSHIGAQYYLGVLYSNSESVPKDVTLAASYYRKAAEQGFAPAQASLGRMYYTGIGIPKDFGQARIYFRKAAEQGDVVVTCPHSPPIISPKFA